eukprot:TRINITY_DN5995_c0_g1_i3.p1 TRINITY_DN5995_c0_g1~~TRINITY_DN5995_c0_g1_i3.p1  ORF type:complete len:446 (-),score=67.93 TRINITY_DN5995_c0_g1_i3:674-1831(-)
MLRPPGAQPPGSFPQASMSVPSRSSVPTLGMIPTTAGVRPAGTAPNRTAAPGPMYAPSDFMGMKPTSSSIGGKLSGMGAFSELAEPSFDSEFPALGLGGFSGSSLGVQSRPSAAEFSIRNESDFPALPSASQKDLLMSSMDSKDDPFPSLSQNFSTSFLGGQSGRSGATAVPPSGSFDQFPQLQRTTPGSGTTPIGAPAPIGFPPASALKSPPSAPLGMAPGSTGGMPSTDRFGLLGLLNVIRVVDADVNYLAVGTDLTTLGLDLNSADVLYANFTSPWDPQPSRPRDPEFVLPSCYRLPTQTTSVAKISQFTDETLFYVFYTMPRDVLQTTAAIELYERNWRFHKELKVWLMRAPGTEPVSISEIPALNLNTFDLLGVSVFFFF